MAKYTVTTTLKNMLTGKIVVESQPFESPGSLLAAVSAVHDGLNVQFPFGCGVTVVGIAVNPEGTGNTIERLESLLKTCERLDKIIHPSQQVDFIEQVLAPLVEQIRKEMSDAT